MGLWLILRALNSDIIGIRSAVLNDPSCTHMEDCLIQTKLEAGSSSEAPPRPPATPQEQEGSFVKGHPLTQAVWLGWAKKS